MLFSMNKSALLGVENLYLYLFAVLLLSIIFVFLLIFKFKGKRMRLSGLWITLLLLITALLFTTGYFGSFVEVSEASTKKYSPIQLKEDLDQLQGYIMGEHSFLFQDRKETENLFKSTRAKINGEMTELEFYRLINPVITNLKCGHTNLYISEALEEYREENARFFPLKITLNNDKLYFLESDQEKKINSGAEISSINGLSSGEIINILRNNISSDDGNMQKRDFIISRHFNLKYYDFIDSSDKFKLEFYDENNQLREAELSAAERNEFNFNAWNLHFYDALDGELYDYRIEDDYALLNVEVFIEENEVKFEQFLEGFFAELKQRNINKLILDIRGNYGASPFMAKELLSYLVQEETEYLAGDFPLLHRLFGFDEAVMPAENNFQGELVVLTDGAAFSTTAHFVSIIKYHELGTLVGAETGGTYICSDSSKDLVLDNTRMRIHYSTMVYQTAVSGFAQNKGIEPDHQVDYGIEDIINKRDLHLDKAKEVLDI